MFINSEADSESCGIVSDPVGYSNDPGATTGTDDANRIERRRARRNKRVERKRRERASRWRRRGR